MPAHAGRLSRLAQCDSQPEERRDASSSSIATAGWALAALALVVPCGRLAGLERIALMRDDPLSPPAMLRDPDDDYLVALAREASAEAIVTGDRDLLDHPGLQPEAITAREACRRLGLPLDETL